MGLCKSFLGLLGSVCGLITGGLGVLRVLKNHLRVEMDSSTQK
jgi:hypothetical protein